MPALCIEWNELKKRATFEISGITFDRSLCESEHITRVIGKSRRALVALETIAGTRLPQRILVILFRH